VQPGAPRTAARREPREGALPELLEEAGQEPRRLALPELRQEPELEPRQEPLAAV
jgi:hypothetical protein